MFRPFLALILLALIAPRANSMAAYQSPEIMVANSQAIALVSIEKIEPVRVEVPRSWIYTQKASATVLQSLKGDLKGEITLWGGETFICARCLFQPGKMLVFLKRDGDLWTGNNWQGGARPVVDDQVRGLNGKTQPLETVLAEVSALIQEQAKAPIYTIEAVPAQNREKWAWQARENRPNSPKWICFSRAEFEKWLRERPIGSTLRWEGERPSETAPSENEWKSIAWWRGLSWIDARQLPSQPN